jgi:hypothetical protein
VSAAADDRLAHLGVVAFGKRFREAAAGTDRPAG